jgi:SAM-dependent methyltransferase
MEAPCPGSVGLRPGRWSCDRGGRRAPSGFPYAAPMSEDARRRWDGRHAEAAEAGDEAPGVPSAFVGLEHLLPTEGHALDLACGRGQAAVWFSGRGLRVWGVDVSPVAVGHARALAARHDVADRCRFDVVDLDGGLPHGPPVDLLLCQRFRDPRLYGAMMERIAPGGVLAVAVLSEVGASAGRFRAPPGELSDAFGELEILAFGEGDGLARIVARRPRG